MDIAQRIGQAHMIALKAKGVNVITNALPPAGQTVMHMHVHVIPRYGIEDHLRLEMLENTNREQLNLPVLAQKIKANL
jgi:histidine triad (HIT) family protein